MACARIDVNNCDSIDTEHSEFNIDCTITIDNHFKIAFNDKYNTDIGWNS